MRIIHKPIEVITSHDPDGKVTPLRFRIKIDGEYKVYDVKVKVRDTIKVDKDTVFTYICEFEDDGIKKECELRFNVNSTSWKLYRM